jgi:hypothetical protein
MLQLQPNQSGQRAILGSWGRQWPLHREFTVTHYRHLSARNTPLIAGMLFDQVPAAGYLILLVPGANGYPATGSVGTPASNGYVMDFNWTYDASLIRGCQITSGVTFSQALKGNTPNYTEQCLQGNESANFYILFNQSTVKWQAGINYTIYFGGNMMWSSADI